MMLQVPSRKQKTRSPLRSRGCQSHHAMKMSLTFFHNESPEKLTVRRFDTLNSTIAGSMRGLLTTLRRLPGYRTLATAATDAAAAPAAAESSTTAPKWTPFTQRTGVIARKRGMTAVWDSTGRRWPVTVLQLDSVQVVRHQPPSESDKAGLHSLQIGASDRPERSTTKQQLGHYRKAGVKPKYKLREFRVTPDAVLPVGTTIGAGHFVPGQYVDVQATS